MTTRELSRKTTISDANISHLQSFPLYVSISRNKSRRVKTGSCALMHLSSPHMCSLILVKSLNSAGVQSMFSDKTLIAAVQQHPLYKRLKEPSDDEVSRSRSARFSPAAALKCPLESFPHRGIFSSSYDLEKSTKSQ